ncbi:grpb/dephospho-CoA kinase [Kickxella alabastrina]|uniref:grpb/dephospho-CoA kinase n=1 Tax=Kickxella alabastrina TaxID=61397 RepID=UPI0022207ED8|nr:grpb/dephospho-CoA kinase [Kickxella alabastrina]KAI7826739.1 grpb/dephospho-CoA kinase [Kickxella alabastrina]
MAAKPIIDIQAVVNNFNNPRICVTGLRSLRYAYKGECNIAGREYFKKPGYHIHMVQINNAEYTRRKLFVQYLRDNEDARIEYVNLKRQLDNK